MGVRISTSSTMRGRVSPVPQEGLFANRLWVQCLGYSAIGHPMRQGLGDPILANREDVLDFRSFSLFSIAFNWPRNSEIRCLLLGNGSGSFVERCSEIWASIRSISAWVGDADDQSRLPDFVAGPEACQRHWCDERRDCLVNPLKFLFLGPVGQEPIIC